MDYFIHVAIMVLLYMILSTSFNLLIGYTGVFSIAHAAFYGIGSYTSALVALHWGVPFLAAMAIAVAFTALMGALIAIPALRVRGDYMVIASFGFQMLVFGIMLNWLEMTQGEGGLAGIPRPTVLGMTFFEPLSYLPLAVVFVALTFLVAWWAARSPFGRVLKAIREDEVATAALGKDVVRFKVAVFALAGGLAAVAGSFYAHYITFINPLSFTLEESIFIMALVIVGGVGNLFGSLLGAAVLVIAPEALRFLDIPDAIAAPFRQILYGFLLILFVRFRPQGLIGEYTGTTTAGPATAEPPTEVSPTEERQVRIGAVGQVEQVLSRPASRAQGVVLALEDVSKHFGGITAVSHLSMTIPAGEITGLIGPNGAGKTTIFNLITGFLSPDSGRITCRDQDFTGLKPHQITALGVARSFQDLRLFQHMTVFDNVLVALPHQLGERLTSTFGLFLRVLRQEKSYRRRALHYLEFVGLAEKAYELAENLSFAEQKLLALARLLATETEVLLLDEPASGLDPTSVGEFMTLIQRLVEYGKTICIIEHNLDVIQGLVHSVIFLDEGQAIASGSPETIMGDPRLAEIYFGV